MLITVPLEYHYCRELNHRHIFETLLRHFLDVRICYFVTISSGT